MLKIGLSYNLKDDVTLHEERLEDSAAEYEDGETVDAIERALRSVSDNIVRLPCNHGFMEKVQRERPDVVFNIAEGYGGRNREGYAPTVYDMLSIPYTGSDALSLSLTLDKAHTKRILLSERIPTPDFKLVSSIDELNDIGFGFPMIVKPAREGTSKGITNKSKVDDPDRLNEQVSKVLENYRQPAIVERFIEGREFASAVLHNNTVDILPIVEVMFEAGKSPFYSYECKLAVEESLECPANIEADLKRKIDEYTLKVYKLFDLRHLARIDIRVGDDGVAQIIEVNALPGLSPRYSLYPMQAERAGYSYDDMICEIIHSAIKENGL